MLIRNPNLVSGPVTTGKAALAAFGWLWLAAIQTQGAPCLAVTNLIACALPGQCGTFGAAATGIRSEVRDPAFCYQIIVTNCGNHDLYVTVTDEQLGLTN